MVYGIGGYREFLFGVENINFLIWQDISLRVYLFKIFFFRIGYKYNLVINLKCCCIFKVFNDVGFSYGRN